MRRVLFVTILVAGLLYAPDTFANKRTRARTEVLSHGHGYYKDIFMDGGIALTSRKDLPSSKFLGLEMEYFASAADDKLTQKDTLIQANIFCGNEKDTNGWLLYPDGAPRFRMVYINGGKAKKHAASLGDKGGERIREFIAHGGSYIGTCAGAFIGSKGSVSHKDNTLKESSSYWHVWPGYVQSTRLRKSRPTLVLERKSPLLRYYDFGGDGKVEKVFHNGGCSAFEGSAETYPKGTEALARYRFKDSDTVRINSTGGASSYKIEINGKVATWAYKAAAESGRVILCGSHPEGVGSGERLEYMSAMVLYAMDGNAAPQPKGLLTAEAVREMNKRTEDNDPAYTRIGDRQYHHFQLDIPRKCNKAVITIEGYKGEDNFDLSLCAKQGELAFHDNTLIKSVIKGCKKSLTIERPKSGKWFVSVFCETTVTAHTGKYGTYYRGRLSVLNGVPYKISVHYE